jgi:hypothetical protein
MVWIAHIPASLQSSAALRWTSIVEEIETAVGYQTDFHQFMLHTPVHGTPLYKEIADQGGRLLTNVDLADIHGQYPELAKRK